MIEAAGQMGMKHHSLFHRVFAKARWSLDRLGLALFDLLRPCCGETVFLVVDDTLANKRGRKVFGTGMHYDPMLSRRSVHEPSARRSGVEVSCQRAGRLSVQGTSAMRRQGHSTGRSSASCRESSLPSDSSHAGRGEFGLWFLWLVLAS